MGVAHGRYCAAECVSLGPIFRLTVARSTYESSAYHYLQENGGNYECPILGLRYRLISNELSHYRVSDTSRLSTKGHWLYARQMGCKVGKQLSKTDYGEIET